MGIFLHIEMPVMLEKRKQFMAEGEKKILPEIMIYLENWKKWMKTLLQREYLIR